VTFTKYLNILERLKKLIINNIYLFGLVAVILAASIATEISTKNSLLTIPLLLSAILSYYISKFSIPILNRVNLNQVIRKEGPSKHLEKSGTPTMGGLLIIPIGLIIGNLFYLDSISKLQIISISCLTLTYMLIGIIDDWKGLTKNRNKGLSGKEKIGFQVLASIIFLQWANMNNWIDPKISLYFNNSVDVGLIIWPIALFVLLAESNATNLTDGLDGLASGCGALVFAGLGVHLTLSEQIYHHSLGSFCLSMAGIWIGFLFHNRHPAKIFMGDTGSLAMGGCLGAIALLTNNLWALFAMGGIFFAESLSVILQVTYFKITKKLKGKGKRLFLMAPLHHHFELEGIKEEVIVHKFWLLTICLIGVSFLVRSTS
tara:strand:+ start:1879 stop:2997 length:1119 start_codon:yes stop_codon:yes gene_type:complete